MSVFLFFFASIYSVFLSANEMSQNQFVTDFIHAMLNENQSYISTRDRGEMELEDFIKNINHELTPYTPDSELKQSILAGNSFDRVYVSTHQRMNLQDKSLRFYEAQPFHDQAPSFSANVGISTST